MLASGLYWLFTNINNVFQVILQKKHKSNVTHNNAFDMLLSDDETNENPIKTDKKSNR